jgi:DNA-binding transcriptional LysR family regulator
MSVFDDMTVFVRAVEVGSFSGAAQQLGIAKSIVSRRILSLESRLGTSMFHRSTRRLSLTETGLAYYERARRILADLAEAEDLASQLQGELRGRLKVAAPMSFGYRHLSPVVTDFLRAHPQVDIELDLNDRRVDLISDGFDIAVRIGSLPDSSIISRTLAPCRHVVCASPAYIASHGRPQIPAELASESHVCLAYNNRPRAEQWRFLIDDVWTDVPVKARHIHSNNGDILCEAAVAGLGIIVLPTFIVSDAVARGALEVLLTGYEVASPSILAVWPPSRHVSGKVRAFVDLLAKRFGKTPYWDKFPLDGIESRHPVSGNMKARLGRMVTPQLVDSRAH